MQDNPGINPGSGEAKHPIGRTPASGTDSGNATVPGGGGNAGTGNRGVAGIGTAGGGSTAAAPEKSPPPADESKQPDAGTAADDLNHPGPAGDYSR